MEKWELVLNKFIEKNKKKKEIIGILVCGSYITGSPSSRSDIDIQIVYDDNVNYRERGNEIIDGFLIEYFAATKRQIFKHFEGDYQTRHRPCIHMFATGKILYDKKGYVKDIVKESKRWLNKKQKPVSKPFIEQNKYHLFDALDSLEELYEEDSLEFNFHYYASLNKILNFYTAYLKVDIIPTHKALKILISDKVRNRYNIQKIEDKKFVNMFVKALKLTYKEDIMVNYRKLTDYVLKQTGGFNIDGFKLRNKVD